MIFHRFRRRPGRGGRALRPAGPPANPSPRPPTGELGRSELADETEAFLDGRLAELRAANGSPDEIRQVQHDVLVPLELQLITRSRDEPLTFAQVTAAVLDAIDHHYLDR
jgi:hypothetical protein